MGKLDLKLILLFSAISLTSFLAGFYINKISFINFGSQQPTSAICRICYPNVDFLTQNAATQARVTEVINQSTLKIKDQNNKEGIFHLNENGFVVYKYNPTTKTVSPSDEVSDVPLNKQVVITFALVDGQYKISSISESQPTNFSPR
ncbi:hypothetical protein HYS93_00235 [Candidatus Daviesbacteria bacterium]|nr:hypothetical protein [Candidatus Daviesbacteria bacterium]